jgi:hypothetical protein
VRETRGDWHAHSGIIACVNRPAINTRRELLILGSMLLLALTLLPLAIWGAGRLSLGDYLRDPGGRTGGPLALVADYVGGILHGSLVHWLVFLGPYLLLLAFRAARAISRS